MTAAAAPDAHPADADLRREGDRIAELADDLGAMGGAPVRQRVEELVSRLCHLYGTGLGSLLRILGGDRADEATRARLLADPLVSSLLVLHGIHPDPEAARAFDPGEPPPAPHAPRHAIADLVQIDLSRSRGGTGEETMNALRALEPFARAWRALATAPEERCQVCAAPLADDEEHPHLVDLDERALLCACARCAGVFAQPGAGAERYRVVPSRVLVDRDFVLGDAQWEALRIPVRLAFLFFNSRAGRWVALYPSPAGAAESELGLEAFRDLAASTPLLDAVEPDVEALLVYGRRGRPFETFLVSIDACYRLVGRVRQHWRGFHGGDAAWREIEGFFADLRARARPVEGTAGGREGHA